MSGSVNRAGASQTLVEAVVLEINGHKMHLPRAGPQRSDSASLICLCRRVIDLIDDATCKYVHPPRARIESRSENDKLARDAPA